MYIDFVVTLSNTYKLKSNILCMTYQTLDTKLEIFDTMFKKIEIEMKERDFNDIYKQNNKLTSTTIIGVSVMETIGSYEVLAAGYGTIGQGLGIVAAVSIGYGINTLISGKSKLTHIITKKQLGYEPKSLKKDILNIISEQ